MWCKFGHVTIEITTKRKLRTPPSGDLGWPLYGLVPKRDSRRICARVGSIPDEFALKSAAVAACSMMDWLQDKKRSMDIYAISGMEPGPMIGSVMTKAHNRIRAYIRMSHAVIIRQHNSVGHLTTPSRGPRVTPPRTPLGPYSRPMPRALWCS